MNEYDIDDIVLRRSWWRRNWIWVVLVIGVGGLVVCCGGVAIFTSSLVNAIKSSEVYQESLTRATNHPDAQKALGLPIREDFVPIGVIEAENGDAHAVLVIHLAGSQDSGLLHVEAEKQDGQWVYHVLELEVDGSGEIINLLGKKK